MADAYVYSWDGSDWKGWFATRQEALEYVRRYFQDGTVYTGKILDRIPPTTLEDFVDDLDYCNDWRLNKTQRDDLEKALLGTVQYCLGNFSVSSVTPEDVLQH